MAKTDIILHMYYDLRLALGFPCDKFVYDVIDVQLVHFKNGRFPSLHHAEEGDFTQNNSFIREISFVEQHSNSG